MHVRAPAQLVDAVVATTSTLFFTYTRGIRRCWDLSYDWGSNSQWRAVLDLFYCDDDGFHLNWNAKQYIDDQHVPAPGEIEEGTLDQRRELLLHRCFVREPVPDGGGFPYWDRISLSASTWPLDPTTILPDPQRAG
ncbi:hypothetical protein [Pseudonocardia sp. TRM90224]|uniref:hypothetical protein n=1 Tax=Pseudonocardia sp. TRM90224 TaxID=2812678 RepID=UPI001E3B1504|nr:hypothetical protein [Pseudonocardia sp. TRM90224]